MGVEIMLNNFIDWARNFAGKSLGKKFEARVTEGKISENSSAQLDIDTPTALARITCWENGNYDAEVIDFETEQKIFSTHGRIFKGQAFSDQFTNFFKVLGIKTLD